MAIALDHERLISGQWDPDAGAPPAPPPPDTFVLRRCLGREVLRGTFITELHRGETSPCLQRGAPACRVGAARCQALLLWRRAH
jgi:hypothetical protein